MQHNSQVDSCNRSAQDSNLKLTLLMNTMGCSSLPITVSVPT